MPLVLLQHCNGALQPPVAKMCITTTNIGKMILTEKKPPPKNHLFSPD